MDEMDYSKTRTTGEQERPEGKPNPTVFIAEAMEMKRS